MAGERFNYNGCIDSSYAIAHLMFAINPYFCG